MARVFARLAGVAVLMVAVTGLWIAPSAAGGGCHGTSTADAAAVTGSVVVMDDCAYSPATIQVDMGDTVTFENKDVFPHTASSPDGGWTTDVLDQGDGETVTFDEAGTFEYVCKLHPGMAGTVIVGDGESASAAAPVGGGSSGTGSTPSDDDGYSFAIALASVTALLGFALGRFRLKRSGVEIPSTTTLG